MSLITPQIIIRRKRDGYAIGAEELVTFMNGLVDGQVMPEQAAALAMAIYFQGMGARETANLTTAMVHSGQTLTWPDGPPVVDKHSTGGIGDKVSLILAPLLAACGCRVPMISGRGLDYTGGTLDKLDSIPGYQSQPDIETLRHAISDVGCAIIGQTSDLAPADRMLYAIRDVTSTVESLPLITASILSKKIAAGIKVLAMDVKCGSGAFCRTPKMAKDLADSLQKTAAGAGLSLVSCITDMNQPLGRSAGNALEVMETIDWLRDNKVDQRLKDVTLHIGDALLVIAEIAKDHKEARQLQLAKLEGGHVAECFQKMISFLGGPTDFVESPQKHLVIAPVIVPIPAEAEGYIAAIDTQQIGRAVVELGGGRKRRTDTIDFRVGMSDFVKLGERVDTGSPLLSIHAASIEDTSRVAPIVRRAITIDTSPPIDIPPLIVS